MLKTRHHSLTDLVSYWDLRILGKRLVEQRWNDIYLLSVLKNMMRSAGDLSQKPWDLVDICAFERLVQSMSCSIVKRLIDMERLTSINVRVV